MKKVTEEGSKVLSGLKRKRMRIVRQRGYQWGKENNG